MTLAVANTTLHIVDFVSVSPVVMNLNPVSIGRSEDSVGVSVSTWFICFVMAHHLAVLVHEYAHSFAAFVFGYKSNPFLINFGGTGLPNLLLLNKIDEQVDYQAMFTQHAGWAVAVVAVAGPGLGNGLTYFVSLGMMNRRMSFNNPRFFLFAYALNVMSVGNFFSYVPIRTFASHGDIGHITQGLGIPAWSALVVLGTPTLIALLHLLRHTMPRAMNRLASGSAIGRRALVTLTVVVVFGFFGAAGWAGYGRISQELSSASLLAIFPILIFAWPRVTGRSGFGEKKGGRGS